MSKKLPPIGKKHVITHRGLEPTQKTYFPESSYEAFADQLSRGFGGIEFDPNPTKDGIIVMHDANLARPTGGVSKKDVATLSTKQILKIPLANTRGKKGRIPTFEEVMQLIQNSKGTMSALHLKSRFQTPETLERIIEALDPFQDAFGKFIVFDIKPATARKLKKVYPKLRLGPSVAHPYDIKRYGASIGNTLITLEQTLKLRDKGLVDGIWGDEWDLTGAKGTSKQLYTSDFFKKIHKAGMFAALVTPELHGTSPGLYGGEKHPDSENVKTLMKRIAEIKSAGADFFCTDYPEEVAKL